MTTSSYYSVYGTQQKPSGSQVLSRIPAGELTILDRIVVMASSLAIVGAFIWVPAVYAWAWRRWKAIPQENKRRRTIYAAMLLALSGIAVAGPHRSHRIGKLLKLKHWQLWKSWLKFVAFEVVADNPPYLHSFDIRKEQAIFAIIPHGIFPFALGFAALTDAAARVFGDFRPVVATATALFPLLRTILSWLHPVDASRSSVDAALSAGDRIGMAPGGIAEIFEGYPKPFTHPDEEYAILKSRKGFIRMAIKHGVPVIPVYCFGATKMFKRLQLPLLEELSKLLRISICVFFGAWGLPVPFRQRLLYVLGSPIFPPQPSPGSALLVENDPLFQKQVDAMHAKFCEELQRIFERHKQSYGWGRKTLRLV